MRKLVIAPLLLLFLGIVPLSSTALRPVSCSTYYDFNNIVSLNIETEKYQYSAGDLMVIDGTVKNMRSYPITEGRVRVQVFYEDSGTDYMVDEFDIANNLSLQPNETKEIGGIWRIPPTSKTGTYQIEAFFVADEFNLQGVSFLRGLGAPITRVQIDGGSEILYIDPDNITVNGHITGVRQFQEGNEPGQVRVSMHLVNVGEPVTATVTYELYSWDDLRSDFFITSSSQQVSLAEDEVKAISYTTPALDSGAYLLKVVIQSDKNKNILKLRIPVLGKRAKLNFLGISKFPIHKGENATVFLCASNSASYEENVPSNITVQVFGRNGRLIFSDTVRKDITPFIDGYKADFIADEDLYYLRLVSQVEDAGGSDTADLVYSATPPTSEKPGGQEHQEGPNVAEEAGPADYTPIVLILLIVIITLLVLKLRKR